MSDDPKTRGWRDRSRINANEDYEVTYWAKKWGVTAMKIRIAVRKVGDQTTDVAKELGKSV